MNALEDFREMIKYEEELSEFKKNINQCLDVMIEAGVIRVKNLKETLNNSEFFTKSIYDDIYKNTLNDSINSYVENIKERINQKVRINL